MTSEKQNFIKFDNITAGYKDQMILNNLSLNISKGTFSLLIGPNGAGKSTVLKSIFGLLNIVNGSIFIDGENITHLSARELLQRQIAYVPQGRNLFDFLTVYQNLELGGFSIGSKLTKERIPEVLNFFPRLKDRINQPASVLSGGEQKQLEIGRALLLKPRIILIDEPSIGLSPKIVQDVFRLLRKLVDGGTTVLMVEQNVKAALKVTDDVIALEMGQLVLHQAADKLLSDTNLDRLFLGGNLKLSK